MGRSNKGLKRDPLETWVNTVKGLENEDKKITGLLLPFTGIRVGAFCHLHGPTCFNYTRNDDGDLVPDDSNNIAKLKVHAEAPCRKYGDYEPCGDCRIQGRNKWEAKFNNHARELPLPETWNNWNRGETHADCVEEDLGLRSFVESYFKLDEDDYGKTMINGDGISKGAVNEWIKKIAKKADLGYERGTVLSERHGERVDIKTHDMRGTYIMQLIRNNYHRTKLIAYTGHEHVSSLAPYERRVAEETDDLSYLDHI